MKHPAYRQTNITTNLEGVNFAFPTLRIACLLPLPLRPQNALKTPKAQSPAPPYQSLPP